MGSSVGDDGGVSDTQGRGRLTGDEVALVLRRAAEIDARSNQLPALCDYDPAAVEEAASEVGLSPSAVRWALAELRVGSLAADEGSADRRPVPAHTVVEQRTVGRPPDAVLAALEGTLRGHLFESRRRTGDQAIFRPRTDPLAKLRRKLNLGGTIAFDGVSGITVAVTPVGQDGEGTLVRANAELATTRSNVVARAATAGSGVALVTGIVGALVSEPALMIGAVPAGALITASGVRAGGRRWQQHRDEIADALAGLLDRLEHH